MKTIGAFLMVLLAGLAAAVSAARPATTATVLDAKVGPGFSITLTQNGTRVTNLAPGDYTINVDDESDLHNFHLLGPGVDEATTVEGAGQTTWNVTLQNGSYTYVCDAHVASMLGKFTVGGSTTTTPVPVKAGATLKAVGRSVTATGTASRTASITVSLWKGAKKVASKTGTGTKVVLKSNVKAAGKYTAKVVAKADNLSSSATRSVAVK